MPGVSPRCGTLAAGLLALSACAPTGAGTDAARGLPGGGAAPVPEAGIAGAPVTDAAPAQVFAPDYLGVQTLRVDSELVNFRVAMRGARDTEDVVAYARCAAAQYALIRGYVFARHVRTNVAEEGGIWRGDAVYTISPSLPQGLRTIDAEVTVGDCVEQGIPTV